jgi:hypothetical protein
VRGKSAVQMRSSAPGRPKSGSPFGGRQSLLRFNRIVRPAVAGA